MKFKPSKFRTYGPLQIIWLGFCRLYTFIFFNGCRLIRLPIFLRGRSRIIFGKNFVCGYLVRLDAFGGRGCISFGENVELNDFVHIGALESVSIGDNVLIGSRVFISDHNHGNYQEPDEVSGPEIPPAFRPISSRPVRIGCNVWLGEQVCVLPGVTVGDGAIVGANSVVTRDIPPNSISVGNPARVVRMFDASTQTWKRI